MGIMQISLVGLLILAMATHSRASFCVCKPSLSQQVYQSAIDFACGAGADCNPIKPNGQCFSQNNIQVHCSFACNSYFQRNSAKGATCDFHGTAVLTNSDPSGGGCSFSAASGSPSTGTTSPVTTVPTTSPTTPSSTPITPVSGGTGSTPVTPISGSGSGSGSGSPTYGTGTGTGTGVGTGTPTTTSPYTSTPTAGNPTGTGAFGGVGGVGTGMAPTGSSMDDNHGIKLNTKSSWSLLVVLVMAGIMPI